jgi:hypothetical protein
MAHNPASELASAIQSAHIVRNPSPHHDVNPSTAASRLVPAELPPSPDSSDIDAADVSETSEIPSDILQPTPQPRSRRKSFPPLPDMRFEQSYLASIKNAQTNTQVAIITVRDQLLLPLLQGTIWNFALFGWRHWNRGSQFKGRNWGAGLRRWWWGVNNWKIPGDGRAGKTGGLDRAEQYYVQRGGSALGD